MEIKFLNDKAYLILVKIAEKKADSFEKKTKEEQAKTLNEFEKQIISIPGDERKRILEVFLHSHKMNQRADKIAKVKNLWTELVIDVCETHLKLLKLTEEFQKSKKEKSDIEQPKIPLKKIMKDPEFLPIMCDHLHEYSEEITGYSNFFGSKEENYKITRFAKIGHQGILTALRDFMKDDLKIILQDYKLPEEAGAFTNFFGESVSYNTFKKPATFDKTKFESLRSLYDEYLKEKSK